MGRKWLLILLLAACAKPQPVEKPAVQPVETEAEIRTRLGIPPEAQKIVIFSQSSHMDIDWQQSFEDYYTHFVDTALTQAHDLLRDNPRAKYSMAEMAFFKRHLQQHPEQLAVFQDAAKRGALHIVGAGMTSPDTLLPELEMLARDFLYGIQFAEETFGIHPTAAWVPDSFGHSGSAPDIFHAAGLENVAMARIDGAPTIFEMIAHRPGYPLANSTASYLKDQGSADFVWQGSGGAQIFAHFLVGYGMYCEGDDLDYDEPLQVAGGHMGQFHGDDPTFTDGKIDGYIAELTPYAKTPYMLVPVGCDFMPPKKELIAYLDGYNQRRYPQTHVWTVAATFDDYAALLRYHLAELPVVKGELGPVYMGAYGSRAGLKAAIRDAARPFWQAEPFIGLLGEPGKKLWQDARPALEKLTRTDHHDFVPGTSADDVLTGEQLPMLADLQKVGEKLLWDTAVEMGKRLPGLDGATQRMVALADFGWQTLDKTPVSGIQPPSAVTGTHAEWTSKHVRVALDAVDGVWALSALSIDGAELLADRSLVLVDREDHGGLWRLGHEMPGCTLSELPAPITAADQLKTQDGAAPGLTMVHPQRSLWLGLDADGVLIRLETHASKNVTRTLKLHLKPGELTTSSPGGYQTRPLEQLYDPTFYPAVSWLKIGDVVILLKESTGVRMGKPGEVEIMAARNAQKEQCDVMGGQGSDDGPHTLELRITTAKTPAEAELKAQEFNRPVVIRGVELQPTGTPDLPAAGSLLEVSGAGVVSALKPADRGEGMILRVLQQPGPVKVKLLGPLAGRTVTRVDLAEREIGDVQVVGDLIDFGQFKDAIVSVRLR